VVGKRDGQGAKNGIKSKRIERPGAQPGGTGRMKKTAKTPDTHEKKVKKSTKKPKKSGKITGNPQLRGPPNHICRENGFGSTRGVPR